MTTVKKLCAVIHLHRQINANYDTERVCVVLDVEPGTTVKEIDEWADRMAKNSLGTSDISICVREVSGTGTALEGKQ